MERLTEYHGDVAVIKNKDFKAAAQKLAMYEDAEEGENNIMKQLEEMRERNTVLENVLRRERED